MPKIIYKNWAPDQGFEEKQAEVFNEANPFKFQPASGEQIKKQFSKDKINPKHVKYAFKDNQMIGYIQAKVKDNVKEIILSYPWTLPGTPPEVQSSLFDDMLSYFKAQKDLADYKFRVNPMNKPESNLEFLQSRGFVEKNVWRTLLISLSEIASVTYDSKYTSRIGTESDIDAVIQLIKDDGRYIDQFANEEAIRQYLTEKVLSIGHLVLLYENKELIAASAPLIFKSPQQEEERIIQRFTAFKNVKDPDPFIPLLIEVAKECLNSGYGEDIPMLFYTDLIETPPEQQELIKHFTPLRSDILMYYYYLERGN
ncbi:hypothetical protein [Candidatus Hodarchaeum mangrovi]